MTALLAPTVGSFASPPTLAAALRWLGHDCFNGCGQSSDRELPVWFIRRPADHSPALRGALVVIDLVDRPVADSQRLLRTVNRCTRAQRIRVRGRVGSDHGRALARVALSEQPAGPFQYLLFGADPAGTGPGTLATAHGDQIDGRSSFRGQRYDAA